MSRAAAAMHTASTLAHSSLRRTTSSKSARCTVVTGRPATYCHSLGASCALLRVSPGSDARLQRAMSGTGRRSRPPASRPSKKAPPRHRRAAHAVTASPFLNRQAASRIHCSTQSGRSLRAYHPGASHSHRADRACTRVGPLSPVGSRCSGKASPDGRSHTGFHRCSAMRTACPHWRSRYPGPVRPGDDVREMGRCGCFMVGIVRRVEHPPGRQMGWRARRTIPDVSARRPTR